MSGSARSLLPKPTLKLVIDAKASKVLFAEAGKVFVDFILGILALPVGALMRLIKEKEDLVCSLGALYCSVDKLNAAFMKTPSAKSLLLQKDTVVKCHPPSAPSLKCEGTRASIKKLYKCSSGDNSCVYATDEMNRKCPVHYNYYLSMEISYVGQELSTTGLVTSDVGDFVLDPITCLVMDDLSVQPMSIARVFDITGPVKDADRIKEITVQVGQDEALKLLKAALNSKNVLTDVFLKCSQQDVKV